MSDQKRFFKLLGKFLLWVLGIWTGLIIIFNFAVGKAFGVALAIMLAAEWAVSRGLPKGTDFRPFKVLLFPKMYPILSDLGLVKNEEEYKAIAGAPKPLIPWTSGNIFHHPLRAFFISREFIGDDGFRGLVHLPDLSNYLTDLRMMFEIEAIELVGSVYEFGQRRTKKWHPEFFFERGKLGNYVVGVKVENKWWDENKTHVSQGVVLDEAAEEWNDRVKLVLGILPYQAFRGYYVKLPGDKEVVARHAELKFISEKGWTYKAQGYGKSAEWYEHKYLKLYAAEID